VKPGTQEFVAEKRIAVVGVSRTRGFGKLALHELRKKGYQVYPVNANADEVDGLRCYRRLADVPGPPPAVLAVVPPAETEKLVGECARLGVTKLWMQQGSESEAAIRAAEAAGLSVVHHACVLMYASPAGAHRWHAGWRRITGRL
jgi:predicted CoA-binding protein